MVFRRNKKSNRDWAVGLDFGASRVRGVLLRRSDAVTMLEAFDVRPLKTVAGRDDSVAAAAAEVAQLFGGWSVPARRAFAVINSPGKAICRAELPRMPLSEARAALRLNGVRYLHRDLSNCYFDLVEQGATAGQPPPAKNSKMQLLIGAAPREEVLWYRNVLLAAKVRPEAIELTSFTVANGLLATEPELCRTETVLLLDLGAHTTALNFLGNSRLLFTHVMYFGSQQITEHLAEKLGVEVPIAEIEKQKMSEPVQALVQAFLSPLARELRFSIDYFDQQHDCRVSRVLACGDAAGSAKTLEILGHEAGVHIEAWNCLQHLDTSQTRGDCAQLAVAAPELAAAIGAALARL